MRKLGMVGALLLMCLPIGRGMPVLVGSAASAGPAASVPMQTCWLSAAQIGLISACLLVLVLTATRRRC